ncbi:hypothetical protein [Anaerosporobacter faecicola]|uniref:hypothetical protein n=1 Tax=Anaerosporobacter faecicola TaxID=2718714 RepID=UPI00143A08F9|nr:hypothetical protein [Anaerosporobacter faecicola]
MEDKLKKSYIWSFVFLIVELCLIYVLKYLTNEKILFVSFVGVTYMVINLFFMKYKRERLFVNGLITYFTVVMLGVLVGIHLEVEGVLSIGAAISVSDLLSFTKYGKETANAKAMGNKEFMYKAIIYGCGKKDNLYPTCGFGDYFYFALWLSGLSHSVKLFLLLALGLLIGNLINKVIILKLHNKSNYRGIPATPIPFLCVMMVYFIW